MIEKFEVRNRWTNAVQFTAEIEVTPTMTTRFKLGLAVRWGRNNGANLSGADLRGANLSGANLRYADLSGADLSGANLRYADLSGANLRYADLSGADLRGADLSGADLSGANLRYANLRGADLRGANLSGADLRGANLRGANLRSFKSDFWMTLTYARDEVPALIAAIREGRVNGSQYEGECACLVGTLANARGQNYAEAFPDHNARNPAERWFLMIKQGDKPGDDTGGGFAAGKALEWALEWCALNGVEAPQVQS